MTSHVHDNRESSLDQKSVVGILDTADEARIAVEELLRFGVSHEQIAVVASSDRIKQQFSDIDFETSGPDSTGAVLGAGFGAALGATLGAVGILTIGGLPIALAALGGIAAGGITGGLTGAMVERGFTADAADLLDQALQADKILVAVSLARDDEKPSSKQDGKGIARILEKHGHLPPELAK